MKINFFGSCARDLSRVLHISRHESRNKWETSNYYNKINNLYRSLTISSNFSNTPRSGNTLPEIDIFVKLPVLGCVRKRVFLCIGSCVHC